MTARWVVDEVAPHRDLTVTWQPISLYVKNAPEPGSEYHDPVWYSHRLLRIVEAARAGHGDDVVQPLYWEYGRRFHHDGDRAPDPVSCLEAVGLDPTLADAFDDERWDAQIDTRMQRGLDLAGTDIGTPIIGFVDDAGADTAIFGPVITRVPPTEQSLRLWDGMVMMATVPGFWELKRTRTERPEFGDRP